MSVSHSEILSYSHPSLSQVHSCLPIHPISSLFFVPMQFCFCCPATFRSSDLPWSVVEIPRFTLLRQTVSITQLVMGFPFWDCVWLVLVWNATHVIITISSYVQCPSVFPNPCFLEATYHLSLRLFPDFFLL